MGNAFCHIELNTDDTGKAKKFYKSLFDWKIADMPGMPYAMIDVGKGTGGGMQKHPMPGSPNAWLAYVEVADIKKTVAKAEKSGGKVLAPIMDVGMGSIAVLMDPSNAVFGLWEPAKKTAKKTAQKAAKKTAKKR